MNHTTPGRYALLATLSLVLAAGCSANDEPVGDAAAPSTDVLTAADVVTAADVITATDVVTAADAPDAPDTSAPPVDAAVRVDAVRPDAAPVGESVTVRITAPASGAMVSGVVSLTAAATATAGVARVVFYSEGGAYEIGADRTAPYGLDWYTTGYVPDGVQRLRAVAFDAAGRSAVHELDVRVRNAPGSSTLPAAEVARVTAWFEARRSGRYLEGSCQPTTYPDWAGVPLQLCRYRVSDSYSGGTRQADVILADAEPSQLARWVVQAALERRGSVQRSDVDALCSNIIGQSGAQFPVAGVVYEDMDGTGQRIYPFRHGVTVRIEGLPYATREQPTAAQMAAYRTAPIAFVGRYGRIAGTTPDEWTALTREAVPADRSTWPAIVGRAYRAAWGQDRTALLVAWARANL